jgi:hypothetical protein
MVFLRDETDYEMFIECYENEVQITISDPEVELKSLSFLLKDDDVKYVIEKLKSFKNG